MCFPQEIFTARNYDIGPLLLPRRGLEAGGWARIWWSLRDGTLSLGRAVVKERARGSLSVWSHWEPTGAEKVLTLSLR